MALLPMWKLTHDLETSLGMLCFSKVFLKKEYIRDFGLSAPGLKKMYFLKKKKSYFKNQWFDHSKNTFKIFIANKVKIN